MATVAVHRNRLPRLLVAAIFIFSLLGIFAPHPARAVPPAALEQFCVNNTTGEISAASRGRCRSYQTLVDLTTVTPPTHVCANDATGTLRHVNSANHCRSFETYMEVDLNHPTTPVCVNARTGGVRHVGDGGHCRSAESAILLNALILIKQLNVDCQDCPEPIAEYGLHGGSTNSTLAVSGGGTITDVNVTIDLAHTWVGELDIFLYHPDGHTRVHLVDTICTFFHRDLAVVFDDEAASVVGSTCPATGFGTFQPSSGSLSIFDGMAPTGDWWLEIIDPYGRFQNSAGNAGVLWDWSLDIETTSGQLPIFSCTDCVLPIPNNLGVEVKGATISALPVTAPPGTILGTVQDLDVTLDFSHTWIGELDIFLVNPGGIRVQLIDEVCQNQNDMQVILDDEAAGPITGAPCPPLGFSSFQPSPGALSTLDGQPADGTWFLVIIDKFGPDGGTLHNWTLSFELG